MTLIDLTCTEDIDVPTATSSRAPSFTPDEVKRALASGTAGTLLRPWLPDAHGTASRADVRLLQEKHRRDSTTLMVQVGPPGQDSSAGRTLVLHFPRPGLGPASALARAWWYPADPYLPALAGAADPQRLLRQGDWTSPAGRRWVPDGNYEARRLGYKPGQRASFALLAPPPAASLMLKIVRPAGYPELLARALAIDASTLRHTLRMPRLLATSDRHNAFLYEFLPGRGLDTLTGDEVAAIGTELIGEFIRLAGAIHRVALPGIPAWSPATELGKSRPLLALLAHLCPAAAGRLDPIVARLGLLFAGAPSSGRLIHNDFTARNLLYDAGVDDQPRLTVIDWDSAVTGPAERDVAAFLSSRLLPDDAAGALLTGYDAACGGRLDRDLITGFVAHQRLLKATRRYLAGRDQGRLIEALALVTHRLEHNPLAW